MNILNIKLNEIKNIKDIKEIKDKMIEDLVHYKWCTGEDIFDKKVWKRGVEHFKTITKHRHLVMKYCMEVGLYKQGLLHDLSKYNFIEFVPGMLFYQNGLRSPNNGERETMGVTKAWLHHKGKNKHHFEYWMDFTKPPVLEYKGALMDDKYVIEMFMDRIAACEVYQGDKYTDKSAWEYFDKSPVKPLMNEYTLKRIEHLLKVLANHGKEITFTYVTELVSNGYKWQFGLENAVTNN